MKENDFDDRAMIFLKRLSAAIDDQNPFAMAVITYQTLREGPQFEQLKKHNKECLIKRSKDAIDDMSIILHNSEWKQSDIDKFEIRCGEL
ncbi:MAG: hypothetical protein ACXQT0_04815, partial [Candidatus Methanofastidiosia archaeon]